MGLRSIPLEVFLSSRACCQSQLWLELNFDDPCFLGRVVALMFIARLVWSQVFMLTGLTKLRLSDNEIGIIPPEIAGLENLRHLILDRNKVIESVGAWKANQSGGKAGCSLHRRIWLTILRMLTDSRSSWWAWPLRPSIRFLLLVMLDLSMIRRCLFSSLNYCPWWKMKSNFYRCRFVRLVWYFVHRYDLSNPGHATVRKSAINPYSTKQTGIPSPRNRSGVRNLDLMDCDPDNNKTSSWIHNCLRRVPRPFFNICARSEKVKCTSA